MQENKGSTIGRLADLLGGAAGRIIIAALLILIAFELGQLCYSFGRSIFYQDPMETAPGTDVTVVFEEGCTREDAADILEQNRLIRDADAFSIQEMLYEVNISPGEYKLNTSMTTKELIEEINISEEEYQARLAESEKAQEMETSDVIGGGDEADIITPEEAAAMTAGDAAAETAGGEAEAGAGASLEADGEAGAEAAGE